MKLIYPGTPAKRIKITRAPPFSVPDVRDPRGRLEIGFLGVFSAGGDVAGTPSPTPGDAWPPTIARTLTIWHLIGQLGK